MKHEFWIENEDEQTFCLAGRFGDDARRLLEPGAKLVWTCDASSHFEAMTKCHEYMGWGPYTADYPEADKKTFRAWLGISAVSKVRQASLLLLSLI